MKKIALFVLMSLMMPIVSAIYDDDSDLILYMKFDDSGSTMTDYSPNNFIFDYVGSMQRQSPIAPFSNYSMGLNGAGDYAYIDSQPLIDLLGSMYINSSHVTSHMAGKFTTSFWTDVNDTGDFHVIFSNFGVGGGREYGWYIVMEGGYWKFYSYGANDKEWIFNEYNVDGIEHTMFTFVLYGNDTMDLYINDTVAQSVTRGSVDPYLPWDNRYNNTIIFGRAPLDWDCCYWNTPIDEFTIFNRSLSSVEIADIYENGVIHYEAPVIPPAENETGYTPQYSMSDLAPIIIDGIGTAGASAVSWTDVVVLLVVLLALAGVLVMVKK